jgi:hypothetical protein
MKSIYSLLVVTAFTLFGVATAEAGTTKWSVVGSGCVIDSAYTSQAVINSQNGSVSFAPGATGWILMTCPVAVFTYDASPSCYMNTGITTLNTNSNGYIKGWLAYITRSTTSTSVGNPAVVTSSVSASKQVDSTIFTHAFDFEANYYWVNIEMHRTNTTSNPTFYGTWLQNNGPIC